MVDDNWAAQLQDGKLQQIYDIAANWAASASGRKQLDFELLYSAVHAFAEMEPGDLAAIPFSPHRGNAGLYYKSGGRNHPIGLKHAQQLAGSLREELRNLVHEQVAEVDPSKSKPIYLPLFDEILDFQDKPEIQIFTTNYDRAIEAIFWEGLDQKHKTWNFRLLDGFSESGPGAGPKQFEPDQYDETPTSDRVFIKLYKIHGSVHWIRRGDRIIESGTDDYLRRNIVIYPLREAKPSTPPFRTLLERFEAALKHKLDVLLVLGSSLRDAHIRELIVENLEADTGINQVVILDRHPDHVLQVLEEEGASQGSLVKIAGDFGTEESLKEIKHSLSKARNRHQS